jgi:hypothetical protein
VVVLIVFTTWAGSAWGSQSDREESAAVSRTKQLTADLVKAIGAFHRATPEGKGAAAEKISAVALERREAILGIIADQPAAVVAMSLPGDMRESLPAAIRKFIEEWSVLEGDLEVLHFDDFSSGVSRDEHVLVTSEKQRYRLHGGGERVRLLTGTPLRVRGVKVDGELALSGTGDVQVLGEPQLAPLMTMKKVAVILFNFANNTAQPYDPDLARSVTFTSAGSANAFYQEASFGKIGLQGLTRQDGDIFGWYTIGLDAGATCDYSAWASAARTAAAADGFSTSGYNVIVYAFPQVSACGWWGLGSIGGNPASMWVNGSYALRVVAHEMGHNFGAHHSSSYSCVDESTVRVPISTSCTSSEYGDPFDVMGGSSNHFNVFQKGRLGYLDPANTQTVTASGTYTIAPVEWASAGVQSLRIPSDKDSGGAVTQYYYLEFRQPFGFDPFSTTAPVVNGLSIRLAPPYGTIRQSLLIDATAATTSFSDAPLTFNAVFEDALRGITVRTIGVTPAAATVEVVFGPGTCVRSNPSVSLSPTGQWGFVGEPLAYTLTLTNNDSDACQPSTFSVVPTFTGAGWVQSPASLTESLLPGTTVSRTVTITSPVGTGVGVYLFTETVTNTSAAGYSAAASANYNVKEADNTPPVVSIKSPAANGVLPKKGFVLISASASDANGISRMVIRDGSAVLKTCLNTAVCEMKWNVTKVATGPHIVSVEATDNAKPTANTRTESVRVTK